MRDLYRFRWLLLELTLREFRGRYSSARLGVAWAVLNPLLQMVVFTGVFARVLRVSSEGFPYSVWVLCALLMWQTFRSAVTAATSSVVDDRVIIKRVVFPRSLIVISIVVANCVNCVLTLPALFVLMLALGCALHVTALLFVVPIAMVALLATGVGLCTSALTVHYRDVRHLMEPALLFWFYASPIFYSADAVPRNYQAWYRLNPFVGIIELSRGLLLRGHLEFSTSLGMSLATTAAFVGLGALTYRRWAPTFADLL
jgi:ABC-type polysaccharide/polyol phosphate export permease